VSTISFAAPRAPQPYFAAHADAEDQQDHRIERHLRDRVERHQDRLGHFAGEARCAQRHADQQSHHHRDGETLREGERRLPYVRQETRIR